MSETEIEIENARAAEEVADKVADLVDEAERLFGLDLDPWQRIMVGTLFGTGIRWATEAEE